MKILIISNTPWDDNNSFGNSFSNIFGGNPNYEIANIYCQPGWPNTKVATKFFQITEKDIVRKFMGKQMIIGHEVFANTTDNNSITELSEKEQNTINSFKLKRWQILFWLRDLIWANGNWKSPELDTFITDFSPDLIFQPIYYSSYINEIGLYAKQLTGKNMVGYMSDDNYTLKRYSLSPLFWIDRLIKRHYVKKACDASKLLYVISEMQRREFNRYFGDKCEVLYKGANFDKQPSYEINKPLKFVYTGNIGAGRWKTLAKVAKALERINIKEQRAIMYITTPSPINQDLKLALNIKGSSYLLGKVSLEEKSRLQREADILLHVNSFDKSEKFVYRLSFSTKLVDYFETGHTILAIGWKQNADIDYLINNDVAIVVTDEKEIEEVVSQTIKRSNHLIPQYNKKSFDCGKRNHQIDKIRNNLYKQLSSAI